MDPEIVMLFNQFDDIHILSDECKMMVMRAIKMERAKRGKKWLDVGQTCRRLAFVQKGMLASCYTYKGTRSACQIFRERQLCISPSSFFRQLPSEQSIEVIEESLLLSLDFYIVREICRRYPEFTIILQSYLINQLIEWERFSPAARIVAAKNRLNWIKTNFPDIVNRLPGVHLGPFLGMTQETIYRFNGSAKGFDL